MWGDRRPLDGLAVAVVGSREPTIYGRAVTERLSRDLSEAGVTIVSGLARGVDSVAHEAVVQCGGRTFGIMGSGFGRFYPPENRPLAARMAKDGVVVTEYAWPMDPLPVNFPRRNRLISGMSLGVIVVEAGIQSGALITARLAADQGREVFAVPGPIFSEKSAGPHRLLKEGAHPVESAQDVLDALSMFRDLPPRPRPAKPRKAPASLAPPEAAVLDRITLDPSGLDALSSATGMAPGVLAAALLNLELKGLVRALPGKSYVRAEAALRG
jgi:DNA processing protein